MSEMKEVISTLLQGRQYIFSLFHTLTGAEPNAQLLAAASGEASLKAVALFEEAENHAAALLRETLLLVRDLDEETVGLVKDEYTRLFLGPDKLIAPPWESVYTTKERALFQESTLAVRSWYQKYSYEPVGYPSRPDDHISLMMHFLELTTGRALECLDSGLECGYRNLLEGQKLFEKNHLLNWLDQYEQDMQRSSSRLLYPQLATALCAFLKADQELLGELLTADLH